MEWKLENNRYEVIERHNGDCVVKDKMENTFYFQKKYYISQKYEFEKKERICWNWKDNLTLVGIVLSLISMIIVFGQKNKIFALNTNITNVEYIQSVLFIVFNILLHEMAHYWMMRFYGRQAGKIKLKFYLRIFPCLIINTSDSYMLPRYRRGFVYYAGIMINWIICGIVLIFWPTYSFLLRSIVWMNIYNMIPFGGIKTDGYHIIVNTVLDIRELKGKKNLISEITKYVFIFFEIISFYWSAIIMLDK